MSNCSSTCWEYGILAYRALKHWSCLISDHPVLYNLWWMFSLPSWIHSKVEIPLAFFSCHQDKLFLRSFLSYEIAVHCLMLFLLFVVIQTQCIKCACSDTIKEIQVLFGIPNIWSLKWLLLQRFFCLDQYNQGCSEPLLSVHTTIKGAILKGESHWTHKPVHFPGKQDRPQNLQAFFGVLQ